MTEGRNTKPEFREEETCRVAALRAGLKAASIHSPTITDGAVRATAPAAQIPGRARIYSSRLGMWQPLRAARINSRPTGAAPSEPRTRGFLQRSFEGPS